MLLAKGEKVRALGRDTKKLAPLVGLGAEPFVGKVGDVPYLMAAFADAEAIYLLLPEDLSQQDLRAHQERVSDCYAAAIANARVRFVVNLSSIGAQHAKGTGPIAGLHNQEQKLDRIAGLDVLHVRAAYFMENLFLSMAPLRATDHVAGWNAGRCAHAMDSDERHRHLCGRSPGGARFFRFFGAGTSRAARYFDERGGVHCGQGNRQD